MMHAAPIRPDFHTEVCREDDRIYIHQTGIEMTTIVVEDPFQLVADILAAMGLEMPGVFVVADTRAGAQS